MKIVVTPPAFYKSEALKFKLSSLFPNTVYNQSTDYLSEAQLLNFLKDADAAIIGRDPVTQDTLDALPQLMVTPHIGGNSIEAVEAMGQGAIDNLLKYFNK